MPRVSGQSRVVIEAVVAQVFGIGPTELGLATRGRAPAAEARQVAMYLAHTSLGIPMSGVGNLFARDRTTVAHACEVVEDRRDDPTFDHALQLLEWTVLALLSQRHAAAVRPTR
ncbi:MAG: helix-turn-helix domain-containing protein [Hyphomicrobium sp.]